MLYYREKKSNKKHYLRVIILSLIIIVSIISPKTSEYTSRVMRLITSPFAEFTVIVQNSINSMVDFAIGTKPNREMVEKLTKENQDLIDKVNQLELIVNENVHLKEEYDFRKGFDGIEANIIMQDNDYFFKKVILNKGSINGVSIGDIVLNAYSDQSNNIKGALIGKVIEVNETSSIVSTLLDETYNLTFIHSISNTTGVINDRIDNNLNGYMLKKVNMKLGDKIYTSGTGGRYPKGIFIGEIIEFNESEDRLRQLVKVKSPIDFSKLFNVFIIKGN